jgi:transcription elongation factor GreA
VVFVLIGMNMLKQIPMTIKGAEQLKEELQRLKSVDRPNIIQAISEARAQGDLSENAEYESAKERQSFIEGRIAEIEAKLSTAMVIDTSSIVGETQCVFGSTVEAQDLDTEDILIYQIVGDDEADIKNKKISINSPIAKAFIGKAVGDIAEVNTPGGAKSYEILDIKYL